MIYKFHIKDMVAIHPSLFKEGLVKAAEKQLYQKYLGLYDAEIGYIIAIKDIKIDPIGRIISEDGSSNHKVEFDVYAFKPVKGEVVEGEVVGIESFGIFVRIGPVDALVHKSVLLDDIVDINKIENIVVGRKTGKVIKKGDIVRARVLDFSHPKGFSLMKVALYMKSKGLGKVEWLNENINKQETKGDSDETSK
ncbi:MAG: DNA-directed RNA polymerase [Candidatus Geothermarchaeota archaeon]